MNKKHILCPIDFSEGTSKIVKSAMTLAKALNAKLTVLTVVEHLSPSVCGQVDIHHIQQQMVQEAHKKLTTLAQKYHLNKEQTMIVTGYSKETILSVAKKLTVDLIVIGRRGEYSVAHRFLGSTSRTVANAAGCDVYVVHC